MAEASIISRFGATVRQLRFRLGISQEELAARADLHRTYIAGIEGGGRNLTLKSIERLAKALEVSTAALLASGGSTPLERGNSALKSTFAKFAQILLVEDNPEDVELTLHAFRRVNFANDVVVLSHGSKALDFLFCTADYADRKPRVAPGVILLDLNLPDLPGLEVLRRLKSDPRTKDIPVIVLTASKSSSDIAECDRLGAATYIVKPVDFQNFSLATPQVRLQWALVKPAQKL